MTQHRNTVYCTRHSKRTTRNGYAETLSLENAALQAKAEGTNRFNARSLNKHDLRLTMIKHEMAAGIERTMWRMNAKLLLLKRKLIDKAIGQ